MNLDCKTQAKENLLCKVIPSSLPIDKLAVIRVSFYLAGFVRSFKVDSTHKYSESLLLIRPWTACGVTSLAGLELGEVSETLSSEVKCKGPPKITLPIIKVKIHNISMFLKIKINAKKSMMKKYQSFRGRLNQNFPFTSDFRIAWHNITVNSVAILQMK